MFDISFDPQTRVLEWKLTGFWTEGDVHAFEQALGREMARVREQHERFYCLCDSSDFPVQSDPVMGKLAALASGDAVQGSRRFAIVVATMLNNLQAQRSFSSDRIAVFRDRAEALRWLLAKPAGSAAEAA